MHATAFLKNPADHQTGPIVALYGSERFLKGLALKALTRLVLGEDAEEAALQQIPGKSTDLATVTDTLRTVSMWNPRQLVYVEEADEFVTKYRAELEKYLEKP